MKRLCSVLLLCAVLLTVCAASAETVNVGTSAEYRPFVYYDSNYNLTGLDIDILNEVGNRTGLTMRYYDMAFDGLKDSLEVGQVDLIAGGISITEERAEWAALSTVYYSGNAVLAASVNSSLPDSLAGAELKDMRIGVQRGSSFDQWVKTNLVGEGLISTQCVYTYATIDAAMKALKNGSLDIVMLDKDTYDEDYKAGGSFKIVNDSAAVENYVFGAAIDNQALIDKVDAALNAMRGDGTLQQLIDKYSAGGEEAEILISRSSELQAQAAQSAPAPTATPIPPVDQPANCKNVMVFMADVSIPDGTKVNPGQKFTKIWRLYNNGSCKWYEGYTIEFVSGDYMGGRAAVIPQRTIPGTVVEVSIEMEAPQATGQYVGYFQMRAPDGTFFGPTLDVNIIVTEDQVAAPVVGAPPVITRFQPNYYKGDNGFCPTVYWSVTDSTDISLSINNKVFYRTYNPSGSIVMCPGGGKGDYTYGIVARGTKTVSYVFTYTNTGGPKKQPNIVPTPLPAR